MAGAAGVAGLGTGIIARFPTVLPLQMSPRTLDKSSVTHLPSSLPLVPLHNFEGEEHEF